MKRQPRFTSVSRSLRHLVGSFVLLFIATPVLPCTIFVLTDSDRTLFFNNEDYSNPATRIWFLPGNMNYYGCAYVGFDDSWAQGGVNTQGLAFDWVAGVNEDWVPAPRLLQARGNPSEQLLESCATVEEAVAFYGKYAEPGFAKARILVADKTGASAIIGVRGGKLYFDRSTQSRGFGYGGQTLIKMLATPPKPTVENGTTILQACKQDGMNATKYSTVYDLRSSTITLFTNQHKPVQFHLIRELARGGHYYDIPQITSQLRQAPRPLLPAMKRFLSHNYKPIPDKDRTLTIRLRNIVVTSQTGTLQRADFSPEFWKEISGQQKAIQAELIQLGQLQKFTLIQRSQNGQQRSYLYYIEFKNATVLQRFVLDAHNRVALIKSEGSEKKATIKKLKE